MTAGSPAWTWRHAFAQSSLPATTKHVLHTLGMFMNELGEGCYPSVADICRYSGLDKKTVLKHLATARDAGWIAVSQHGYRGQRWKRQEYVARWPERDLTAACPPDCHGEGGGAVPPPSARGKAVESGPEGGGIEGSKVVEQVHQDKTSPETTPDTSPAERAREGEREEGDSRENPRAVERGFERAFRAWPTSISDSRPEAWKAWEALSPDERETAAAEAERYVAASREAGRRHVCSHATYLREKRWEGLPERPEAAGETRVAPPFGPDWMAARLAKLLAGAERPAHRGMLTAFERRMVEQGTADEADLLRDKQARTGFPSVAVGDDLAARRKGVMADPALKGLASMMEAVPVGSETYVAWQREHAARGWPWVPDPGGMRVVYFPAGGPAGLSDFEAAIRGNGDDDGARQAAE